MLLVKENFDIWYDEYVKQRTKSAKHVTSRGGKTRGIDISNKQDFIADFIAEHEDNPKLTGKQLAQKMAKEETYTITGKQAQARAEAIATYHGKVVTPQLIMTVRLGLTDDDEFWAAVASKQLELKAGGYSWQDIQMIIGQEFFGSE